MIVDSNGEVPSWLKEFRESDEHKRMVFNIEKRNEERRKAGNDPLLDPEEKRLRDEYKAAQKNKKRMMSKGTNSYAAFRASLPTSAPTSVTKKNNKFSKPPASVGANTTNEVGMFAEANALIEDDTINYNSTYSDYSYL